MAYGAVVSFEEHRETKLNAEVRQELHNRFDKWLDELEGRVKDDLPTARAIDQGSFWHASRAKPNGY